MNGCNTVCPSLSVLLLPVPRRWQCVIGWGAWTGCSGTPGLAGINVAALDQQDSRVDLTAFNLLLQIAAKTMQNPALGLQLGAWTDSSRMGVIGHIVFNNRTLQQGLEQYQRLSELVNEGFGSALRLGRRSPSFRMNVPIINSIRP